MKPLITSLLIAATLAPAAQPDLDGEKIREYLLKHPEVIVESLQLFQKRQKQAIEEQNKQAMTTERKNLYEDPASPSAGARNDAITIVEFFDYRCGYCKKAAGTVAKVLAENPKVRIVYKEFPILGPESELAAKAALAAHNQGAYGKFHHALMEHTGSIDMQAIETLAKGFSLDFEKLKSDMNSEQVLKAIESNARLAGALGVASTPTFVAGTEKIPGALDEKALLDLAAKAGPGL